MGLEIRIRYPDGNEQTVAIAKDAVSIGRSEDNDLALAFPFVSKRHCRFVQQGASVMIEDVGSLNGVVVNEQAMDKMATQVLRPEDIVHLGTVQISVRAQPTPSAGPTSLDEEDNRTTFEGGDDRTTFEGAESRTAFESAGTPPASEHTGLTGRTMLDAASAAPPPPRREITAATSPLPGPEPEREFTATMWEMQTGVYRTDEVRIDDRRIGTQNAGVALPPPPGFLSGSEPGRAAPRSAPRPSLPQVTAGLVGMLSQLLALGTIFAVLVVLALLVLS